MRIRKLKVTNFRGFERADWEFADRFNLLVGDNGTGKTAVLDALAIGAGSLFLGFTAYHPIRVITNSEIRCVAYEKGGQFTLEPQTPSVVEFEGTVAGKEIAWKKPLLTTEDDLRQIIELGRNLEKAVQAGEDIVLPVISYYSTGRLWLQKKEKPVEPLPPGSRLLGYQDCLEQASSPGILFQWFKTQTLMELQHGKNSTQLDAVKKAVANCMMNWETVYYDVKYDNLIALLKDSRRLPFHLLSDGQRNMLAMTADIAHRCALLNPHLATEAASKTPGIVLIDEIDLHLHPGWQRRVIESLRNAFPMIQFFATTHSPFMVQSLRPGELIDLNEKQAAEYADRSIEDITENVMGVNMPQKSQRYQDMMKTAREYYRLLKQPSSDENGELKRLKHELDELLIPFSDNPAFQAFLKMEREAAGLGGD